jgi:hypothetical protein
VTKVEKGEHTNITEEVVETVVDNIIISRTSTNQNHCWKQNEKAQSRKNGVCVLRPLPVEKKTRSSKNENSNDGLKKDEAGAETPGGNFDVAETFAAVGEDTDFSPNESDNQVGCADFLR